MAAKIRYTSATITGTVLAKVGNPQRDEPLQLSKELFRIEDELQEQLSSIFLKPFKNLNGNQFTHHASLEKNEIHGLAKQIFEEDDKLLENGSAIAQRLYSKSTHPNIKSGDLCISLIKDIEIDGEPTSGICILKSETVQPFLSIHTVDGDLQLLTEQGINPEKIDKGALILDHNSQKGHYVLTFDRGGAESRFWVRDFLNVKPIPDSQFNTNRMTDMAVNFAKEKQSTTESAPDERMTAANAALSYFDEKDKFSMQEFEEQVLRDPEKVAEFKKLRAKIEEEEGAPFDEEFEISKPDVTKARKKVTTVMKLDTGVEIHIKPEYLEQRRDVLEHGFDEKKKMNFVTVYYNEDFA